MASTPAEIMLLSCPSSEEIAALESEIDAQLIQSFKRSVQILYLDYSKWFKTEMHYAIIEERYISKGWVVTRTSDQRDGEFVTIKPK